MIELPRIGVAKWTEAREALETTGIILRAAPVSYTPSRPYVTRHGCYIFPYCRTENFNDCRRPGWNMVRRVTGRTVGLGVNDRPHSDAGLKPPRCNPASMRDLPLGEEGPRHSKELRRSG